MLPVLRFFGRKLHFRKYFEILKKKLNFSFSIWKGNKIGGSLQSKTSKLDKWFLRYWTSKLKNYQNFAPFLKVFFKFHCKIQFGPQKSENYI